MNASDLPRRSLRRTAMLSCGLWLCGCGDGHNQAAQQPDHKPENTADTSETPGPDIHAAAHSALSHTPSDATPSPDGTRVYYTAFTSDSDGADVPGVFAIAADGGGDPVALASGAPLAYPIGIATSLDGSQLYVADRAAGDDASGAILGAASAGGSFGVLPGTENYRPAGLVIAKLEQQETLFFTGYTPDSGQPGLFSIAPEGGAPQVVASGEPLHEPGGVAVAADGVAYVVDSVDQEARVLRIKNGAAEPLVEHIGVGFPAGIALTRDDHTLLISGIDPTTRHDVVYVFDVGSGKLVQLTQTVGQFAEAAGLHRAHDSDVFAWADSQAEQLGTVYVVKP